MKLLTTFLGRIILAASVVMIVLTFISAIFVPAIKNFSSATMPSEKNYVINNSGDSEAFTLSCTKSVYEMLVTDGSEEIDIFADITAISSDNVDLVPLLKSDYEKPLNERTNVFIYKINNDGTVVLSSKIDSTSVGDWAVFYVLEDGSERETLKVNYVFLE